MVNKIVLSCLLKDGKEVNAVMLVGRLFHANATITRNGRSPMVLSLVRGTIRRGQEPDRSRCRDSASSVQWSSSMRYEGALWLRQQKPGRPPENQIRLIRRKVANFLTASRMATTYVTVFRWRHRPDREELYIRCLKKVPTFKLSVTLSNLNRFSKCLHCWKAH